MRPSGEACVAPARCEKLWRGQRRSVCGRQGGVVPAWGLRETGGGQGCHQCVLGVGLAKALTNSVLR